jgi:hypothetical protein
VPEDRDSRGLTESAGGGRDQQSVDAALFFDVGNDREVWRWPFE